MEILAGNGLESFMSFPVPKTWKHLGPDLLAIKVVYTNLGTSELKNLSEK